MTAAQNGCPMRRPTAAAHCDEAITNGQNLAKNLPGTALLLGEMGIGNRSAAALLLARLTGQDIADCTGASTGFDNAGVVRAATLLAQGRRQVTHASQWPNEALAFGKAIRLSISKGPGS